MTDEPGPAVRHPALLGPRKPRKHRDLGWHPGLLPIPWTTDPTTGQPVPDPLCQWGAGPRACVALRTSNRLCDEHYRLSFTAEARDRALAADPPPRPPGRR